jgi:hypothetical protein
MMIIKKATQKIYAAGFLDPLFREREVFLPLFFRTAMGL